MKKYLRVIIALLCVAAVCLVGHYLYRQRVAQYDVCAREAFTKALELEMQKRDTVKVYIATKRSLANFRSSKKLPKEVTVTNEYGTKKYPIVPYKHENNIEDSPVIRMMHGYILEKYPLSVDTLHCVWDSLLHEKQVMAKTLVRVEVTDLLEKESKTYSGNTAQFTPSDSLISYYIGYRCEVEATGFVSYTLLYIYTCYDWLILLGIVLGSILLFLLIRYRSRFLVKKHPALVEEGSSAGLESPVPVITVLKEKAHIYQLESELLFDADSGCLKRGTSQEWLTPQTTILLQAFLEAPDYKLSTQEIQLLLWPDGSGTNDRMYTAIKRLRSSLSKFSQWSVDSGNYAYWLKKPDFIEEN